MDLPSFFGFSMLFSSLRLFSISFLSLLFSYEKPRQIFVDFSVQSRKEMCKELLLFCFSVFTFDWQICHLWLLRVSFVVFDLVISGI